MPKSKEDEKKKTPNSQSDLEQCVMPRALTAENGAKGLLMGEFFEDMEITNPDFCGCGACDFCREFDDVPETIIQRVPISWMTIKDIYAMAVKHLGA